MDAEKQQLFNFMALAEKHQKDVIEAIAGLTVERAALAKERAALAQAVAGMIDVAAVVRRASSDAIPAMQKAASEAVNVSIKQSLTEASDVAAKALGHAVQPVIGRLSGVVEAASAAEGSMRSAGAWFAWKWVAVAAGALAGVCLVAYSALAWQWHQVQSLEAEKILLQEDIDKLKVSVSALEKKGGRIVMTTCGKQLCIEVKDNYKEGNWTTEKAGIPLVIPRGY